MKRIQQLFASTKQPVLNIYCTAGYPELQDTPRILRSLQSAGADIVEIGMPYSDPLADGPTIQASGQKALENGMHLSLLFEQIESVRSELSIPLILMGYFNQVMQYGEEAFFRRCKEVGIDGLNLPDLPMEVYQKEYRDMVEAFDLGMSFLITPQTSPERIRLADELSRGFIYMVSSAAITGGRGGISPEQMAYFQRIEAMQLRNPRLIGFGISDRTSFEMAANHSAGGIVGSAFIRALQSGTDLESSIHDFVNQIRPVSSFSNL
jgi:tryptophan synthase alpha chain